MSSRESVEAAVQSLEEAQPVVDQVLPDQVVPQQDQETEEDRRAIEKANRLSPDKREKTDEELDAEALAKIGRTAGRPRDDKGRLLPGKPVKDVAATAEPVEAAAPIVPAAPAIPRPTAWKKDYQPSWDKIAKEDPQLANYLNQREREFQSGVATYRQEFERVQPLAQAIQPFEQMLSQEGIQPAQWIGAVANAHRILKYGNDQERLQAGLKLIQDYRIPINEFLQQGGQIAGMQQPQHQFMQQAVQQQPQQDPRALVREEIMAMQTATELQQFQSATDASGNPLYPHYEEVKLDMAQLLENGRATDLKSAYTKAIRMNDDLWEAEQNSKRQADQQAQLQEKAKAVAKAKANTISTRSATPTGDQGVAKPSSTRSAVAAAVEASMGQGGRV